MEFCEKLQQLRKSRGYTQEELAEILCVSRATISKWESARGYPNIDSLKDISAHFSVSIDDLLSADKLISIAEKENRDNIKNICGMLFGATDLFSLFLIVLPLYPYTVEGYVYSLNLPAFSSISHAHAVVYWLLSVVLIVTGIAEMLTLKTDRRKAGEFIMGLSVVLSIVTVLVLVLTRAIYAVTVAFILLIVKWILLMKYTKVK